MAVVTLTHRPWARFHDPRSRPIRPDVAKITCFDSVAELIQIHASRPGNQRLKGSGSHWALSEAALSDGEAIETNWPGPELVPRHVGLDVDLDYLYSESLLRFLTTNPPEKPERLRSDPCLQHLAAGPFYVHLKAGTRIYQAYSLLDRLGATPGSFASRLNTALLGTVHSGAYDGPWAFPTLGGAGGQTLFGALTTGTHGGDYQQKPISDSVAALHLVTAGGDHYWIEPGDGGGEIPITDDAKLQTTYGSLKGGRFSIIRDKGIFDAVVVSAGRFGIVASVILRVVPQYCLHEHRTLDDWSNVKLLLSGGANHHVFDVVHFSKEHKDEAQAAFTDRFGNVADASNRFLQIAVNTCPHQDNEHRCGITQRWFAGAHSPEARNPDGTVPGRIERGTLTTAGLTFPYEPSEDPSKAGSSTGTFLQKACSNANFIAGVLDQVGDEVQQVIDDGFVPAAGIAAAALSVGGGAAVLALASICVTLAVIVAILRELAKAVESAGDVSLTQVTNAVITKLLNDPKIPRPVALMAIRVIFLLVFETQQASRDFIAISYAVMDGHDYKDRSCFGNAHSAEVFFDATRPDVYCTYVDAILAFEAAQQENEGRVTAGYVSLRYVRGSDGLIAPSRFEETVVIEVAGIRDAAGTVPFVNNAITIARHPQFSAPFHWGQSNPLTRLETERIFNAAPRTGALNAWRVALNSLTRNGALDSYSNAFTRRAGLEP